MSETQVVVEVLDVRKDGEGATQADVVEVVSAPLALEVAQALADDEVSKGDAPRQLHQHLHRHEVLVVRAGSPAGNASSSTTSSTTTISSSSSTPKAADPQQASGLCAAS